MENEKILKESWLEELRKTRSNREGIGMYTLDTFDDELADQLVQYSKNLMVTTIEEILEICEKQCISDIEDLTTVLKLMVGEIKNQSMS